MMHSVTDNAAIRVENLTMAFGEKIIQQDLNFSVQPASTFIIMGGSGCGKSTLMRHLAGLIRPAKGKVFIQGEDIWRDEGRHLPQIMQRLGVMYQAGALWTSMSLRENIRLPLERFTRLSSRAIDDVVSLKLALVGLEGFDDYYPSEISGGMQKRASIARAMALDPDILFLDEPSAGLDPITSRQLDELIIQLRETLGITFVVVTHELQSIFTIATDSVFLDAKTRTMLAQGNPKTLLQDEVHPTIVEFLTRGEKQKEERHGE